MEFITFNIQILQYITKIIVKLINPVKAYIKQTHYIKTLHQRLSVKGLKQRIKTLNRRIHLRVLADIRSLLKMAWLSFFRKTLINN